MSQTEKPEISYSFGGWVLKKSSNKCSAPLANGAPSAVALCCCTLQIYKTRQYKLHTEEANGAYAIMNCMHQNKAMVAEGLVRATPRLIAS